MKIILLLIFLIFSASAMQAQNMGKEMRVDSVLASVNGEPITLLDVLLESGREELRLASLYSGDRLYSEVAKLRKQVIEEIIVRKLVHKIYLENPFPISNQYIEDMIDHLALTIGGGSREGLIRKAKAMGTTIKELRQKAKEKIAVDILLREYCSRPVYVTPKEVYEYYAKNQSEWTTPTKYELELLQISRTGGRSGGNPAVACQKIALQLKTPEPALFHQLVKANSDAPNAANGGKVGEIDEDKLRPEFAPVVKKMKTGEIRGPIETPEGFYFIRLINIVPATQIPFEKAAVDITKRMEQQMREESRRKYSEDLKKKALIRYYF